MKGILFLAFAMVFQGTTSASAQDVKNPLIGSWKLVSLEETGADGKMKHITDAKGSFIFSEDGHAAVQVMYAPSEANKQSDYVINGYESTFGEYKVNEFKKTFTYKIEGALSRKLVGKEIPRKFQLSGNTLVITSGHAEEKWSATWSRK